MFAGYMQAAAYMDFNGKHGLPGWRYLTLIIYGRLLVTGPLGDGRSSFSLLSTIPICIVTDISFSRMFLAAQNHSHKSEPRTILQTFAYEGLTVPSELKVSRAIHKRVFK
ncbi:Major facilitator superfamily domain general substrate transporter [Penicillium chrysogenum]|uniref:Major facilitator superfamily domain general substrate transporter n=1 Tax=Penicillium chrysogenum TaxID=5076 RepID=A0ABQ8WNC2_PENCH|nr:Major facilitator superfamily domain general substrate transporter [Penicillium chrysogenum]KAJ6145981.1 Major facilitator superfamily domain general substrate transporter [Penicillium chrysogenum]